MIVDQPTLDMILRAIALAVVALIWVVVQIRIVGLRSLSKMTSFDFVMTVALGSLVAGASQASDWSGFFQPMLAMTGLFLAQWMAARLRKASDTVEEAIQNEPILLMRDGEILDSALKRTRVTQDDLFAKMREANVLHIGQVRAAVLETTGDVSILHGKEFDEEMLNGVQHAS